MAAAKYMEEQERVKADKEEKMTKFRDAAADAAARTIQQMYYVLSVSQSSVRAIMIGCFVAKLHTPPSRERHCMAHYGHRVAAVANIENRSFQRLFAPSTRCRFITRREAPDHAAHSANV